MNVKVKSLLIFFIDMKELSIMNLIKKSILHVSVYQAMHPELFKIVACTFIEIMISECPLTAIRILSVCTIARGARGSAVG
jgi:hypothetical protein